jgi:hypothetical protein
MPYYRVYFTINPEDYYFVSAANAKEAVRRAKQAHRAKHHSTLHRIRLRVDWIGRYVRDELRPIKWRP